jgi:hypothetical protein
MLGKESDAVKCMGNIQADRGAEGGRRGEIHEMWRWHKLETHGGGEIEMVQVYVVERV